MVPPIESIRTGIEVKIAQHHQVRTAVLLHEADRIAVIRPGLIVAAGGAQDPTPVVVCGGKRLRTPLVSGFRQLLKNRDRVILRGQRFVVRPQNSLRGCQLLIVGGGLELRSFPVLGQAGNGVQVLRVPTQDALDPAVSAGYVRQVIRQGIREFIENAHRCLLAEARRVPVRRSCFHKSRRDADDDRHGAQGCCDSGGKTTVPPQSVFPDEIVVIAAGDRGNDCQECRFHPGHDLFGVVVRAAHVHQTVHHVRHQLQGRRK